MPQGQILFPTKSGIHPVLGIDAAFELPWMDLQRVCELYPEKMPLMQSDDNCQNN